MEVEGKEMVAEGRAMLVEERTDVVGEGGEIFRGEALRRFKAKWIYT